MSINIEHLTVNKSNFHDKASVVREENHATEPDNNAEILRELQRVREQLETTEPAIAKSVAALEQAVKAKNQPKISELLGDFSVGVFNSVIKSVASKALLSWMGIA